VITHKKIATLIGGAATLAAVVGMTAGLTAATAAPSQTPGATLSVVPQDIAGPEYDHIILYGLYPMQEPDAVGFITHLNDNGCGGMHYTVWGDDGNEQYLFDRNFPGTHEDIQGFLRASNRGLEYRREFSLPRGTLDEDKDGTDEVFVRVRFVDGDCVSRVQNTNVVAGNF
jgi:hypothetical protein